MCMILPVAMYMYRYHYVPSLPRSATHLAPALPITTHIPTKTKPCPMKYTHKKQIHIHHDSLKLTPVCANVKQTTHGNMWISQNT